MIPDKICCFPGYTVANFDNILMITLSKKKYTSKFC